jgi:hypothetical protein
MKVIVNSQKNKTVSVNTQGTTEVISVGIQGPPGPSSVTHAGDVDATILNDGSVLVYKTNTNKWTSTTTLNAQNMDGGEF